MLRPWALLLVAALLLAPMAHAPQAAGQPADSLRAQLASWGAPGAPVPAPTNAADLALRFLEWRYLGDWLRTELAGADASAAAYLWTNARRIRLASASAPVWDRLRRQRALCLYEERTWEPEELRVIAQSLAAGRMDAGVLMAEGLVEAWLLDRAGADLCGNREDPAQALAATLAAVPEYSLKRLKESADFASLFFAAEREVERQRRETLGRVEELLAEEGQLISIKYGFRRIQALEAAADPEPLGEGHWVYPRGVTVDWGKGRRLQVRNRPVLHQPEQHLFRVVEPGPAPLLRREGESLQLAYGEYELAGDYRLLSAHVDVDMSGGRYRRDEAELRLWLPNNFLEANRNGFVLVLLVGAVTGYLTLQNRRKARELAQPVERQRPRRPR